MGRFDTLNAETQDIVNCMLPRLADAFKVEDVIDIIPEDIRMRAWDCDRRDHIKDQSENDARNWGVQFLKDLMAISRIKNGDLQLFQADLRAKVALHEVSHPWARLADIREIKDEYEHPNRVKAAAEESSGTTSTDSYLEELHEPDLPKGSKRRNHEHYEARVQESHKRRKYGRLRRNEDGGYIRKEKVKHKNRASLDRATPASSIRSGQRNVRLPFDDGDESEPSRANAAHAYNRTPGAYSMSPGPGRIPPAITDAVDASAESLLVQKMAAELEVAEAELKAARLKHLYIQAKEAKERSERGAKQGAQQDPRGQYLGDEYQSGEYQDDYEEYA